MNKKIIVYGAGIQAQAFYNVAHDKYDIVCFMVSSKNQGLSSFNGINVLSVSEASCDMKKYPVYVATIDKYYSEIVQILSENGFSDVVSMTFESRAWTNLRLSYVKELFKIQYHRTFRLIDEEIFGEDNTKAYSVTLYCATSPFDNTNIIIPDKYKYERMLLVGSAFCDINELEEFEAKYKIIQKDSDNDNISDKNKQYCELTGLYWIWKNDISDFKGLCHYRRHFDMDDRLLEQICKNGIDVILTVPILNFPSVYEIYKHDHYINDLDVMIKAIEELQPKYLCAAKEILEGNFYSGYNMLIAKKEIFDSYCEWLFPILEYCESKCVKKEERYQERFVGFLAERLLTIYFWENWNKYKIVYSPKNFLM